MVQISVDESEISRRIKRFIERRREQNDQNNILDFTKAQSNEKENQNSCARVDAVFCKQPNGKSLLRSNYLSILSYIYSNIVLVHRVKNEPQTTPNGINPDPSMRTVIKEESTDLISVPFGARERLENSEKYLQIKPSSKSVYERLKIIEERISYLETVSPEYKCFLVKWIYFL